MSRVDPTKVTGSALQNAASVAAMFLTTGAVVTDKLELNVPAISLNYVAINVKICIDLCFEMIASANIFIGMYKTK